jgi:hypothetical protein
MNPYNTYTISPKINFARRKFVRQFLKNLHSHKRGSQPKAYILQSQPVVTIHPPVLAQREARLIYMSTAPLVLTTPSFPLAVTVATLIKCKRTPLVLSTLLSRSVAGLKHMKKQKKILFSNNLNLNLDFIFIFPSFYERKQHITIYF